MSITLFEIFLRLASALVLGALLGWEREATEHNAGLRTNALVALGTAVFTLISGYGFLEFTKYAHIQVDPTRIASYIVAGIGFLGGGAIFLRQGADHVRGLTSAATIWMVAAVGMACGAGMYILATIATLMALFVLIGLRYAEALLFPEQEIHQSKVKVQLQNENGDIVGRIYDMLTQAHIDVNDMHISRSGQENEPQRIALEFFCSRQKDSDFAEVLDALRALDHVENVELQPRKEL